MLITDDWGVLEAENGALLKPDWNAVIVFAPASMTERNTNGNGWAPALRPGWKAISSIGKGDITQSPSGRGVDVTMQEVLNYYARYYTRSRPFRLQRM
jgi:hypothetical protein